MTKRVLMKKLITFVGANPYNPAVYAFEPDSTAPLRMRETRLFSHALIEYLRMQDWEPEEVVVFGTRNSLWSLLYELVDQQDEHLQALVTLSESEKGKGVDELELEELREALNESFGAIFKLKVLPEGMQITNSERLFEFIAESSQEGDEVVLDITHGFRSFGLVALLSAYIIRRMKDVNLKGVYYGHKEGSAHFGLSLELTRLADWAEALAQFRETGEMLGLVRVLQKEPKGEDLAKHMQRFQYGIKTHQIGVAADAVQKALRQCRAERAVPPMTRMFMDELEKELRPFESPEIYKWQLRLAERALNAADYGEASRFMMEAIVSAAMQGTDQVTVAWERFKVENIIKGEDYDPHTCPNTIRFLSQFGLSHAQYHQLRVIRNAVTHGTDPSYKVVEKLMAREDKLADFLRECMKALRKNLPLAAQYDVYPEALRYAR